MIPSREPVDRAPRHRVVPEGGEEVAVSPRAGPSGRLPSRPRRRLLAEEEASAISPASGMRSTRTNSHHSTWPITATRTTVTLMHGGRTAHRARPDERRRRRHRRQCGKIEDLAARARGQGAELVVFPELALTGYPPEDLLLKRGFLTAPRPPRSRASRSTASPRSSAGPSADGRRLQRGRRHRRRRRSRPSTASSCCRTTASSTSAAGSSRGRPARGRRGRHRVGVTICEDIWAPGRPARPTALAGARSS